MSSFYSHASDEDANLEFDASTLKPQAVVEPVDDETLLLGKAPDRDFAVTVCDAKVESRFAETEIDFIGARCFADQEHGPRHAGLRTDVSAFGGANVQI
jgi:hypothetical protein